MTQDVAATRDLVSVEEFAELISISPRQVRIMMTRGEIERIKVGKRTLVYAPREIEKIIERSRVNAAVASGRADAPRKRGSR